MKTPAVLSFFACLPWVTSLCAAPTAANGPLLVCNGKSDYAIRLAGDAAEPERTAARELQEHLVAISGATLPILPEGEFGEPLKNIYVGQTKEFARVFPDIDLDALGADGIVLKTKGADVFLAGGRPRGTLYVVYTLLEDYLGCRWWTSKAKLIPSSRTIRVAELDEIYRPKLNYREEFYLDPATDGVFASRLKLNGTLFHSSDHQRIPEEYGGHHLLLGWVHTFWMLLPLDKYAANHPEWYSMIGGKRVANPEPGHPKEDTQLCLTNKEMRAELTRNALQWLRDNPRATMIARGHSLPRRGFPGNAGLGPGPTDVETEAGD